MTWQFFLYFWNRANGVVYFWISLLHSTLRSNNIIFGFDGPTLPIILYFACECISSSTVVQITCALSNVLQCTSTRPSDKRYSNCCEYWMRNG